MPHIVYVEKTVNLSQLSWELVRAFGGDPPPLRSVQGEWVRCNDDGYPEDLFVDVVNAHVADPDWTPPPPPRRGLLRRLLRRM